ncbi:fungal-specific transcription factor domain-containing protein [Hypomontagnella monticulosa]|nr:fungal-specific transcription factor domain-containing protein [Hypomontagnella monticulosa]
MFYDFTQIGRNKLLLRFRSPNSLRVDADTIHIIVLSLETEDNDSAFTMKTRGCWTCKARRVQCDGGLPACRKCVQARRECQGYGMRLSWPRDGNEKRAIMVGSQPASMFPRPGNIFFINTTRRDIELYRHISVRKQPFHLVQPAPNPWSLPQLRAGDMDLVQFFHSSAYLSLVTFNVTTEQIRDVIIRMALAHDTTSGLALFYALLAFSSLRRNGLHQQAVRLKVAALHYLSASAKESPLSSTEAAQHVAASMLLSAFEILLPIQSSGEEWLCYINGATKVLQVTRLNDQSNESDISHLLDWVYYHDAVSRFPTHHWRRKPLSLDATSSDSLVSQGFQSPPLAKHRPAFPSPNPAHAILNLLSETCDTLLSPWDPRSREEEYHDRLRALEERIENLPAIPALSTPAADTIAAVEIEVYQLATRIYLLRASQSPWESSPKLESLIRRAFTVPLKANFCVHFFPLFILACEARTDEQRASILNLIDRTEKGARIRSMKGLRREIQSIWVQQDLHADSDLLMNYLGIMSAVISSSNTLPSFA